MKNTMTSLGKGIDENLPVRLAKWFAGKIPGAKDIEMLSFARPSGSAGFSGDTYFVELKWQQGIDTKQQKFVIRAEIEAANNPESNFANMVRLLKILGPIPDLLIPKIHFNEDNPEIIGGPFYVMEHRTGTVAPDSPPFTAQGWVYEGSEAQQRHMYRQGVQYLANLHKLNWQAMGLDFLLHTNAGRNETERHVNHLIATYDKAMQGKRTALAQSCIAWLRDNLPAEEKLVVSWGDSRPANMLWNGFELVGALDWEVCSLSHPALDLTGWIVMDRMMTDKAGVKPLPGMMNREQMIAEYKSLSGNALDNFEYYEMFAGFRILTMTTHVIKVWERAGKNFFGNTSTTADNPLADLVQEIVDRVI